MPGRLAPPKPRHLASRLRAERWLLDRARQTAAARQTRVAVERARIRALVRREGSVDSALDRIVADALASTGGSSNEPESSP